MFNHGTLRKPNLQVMQVKRAAVILTDTVIDYQIGIKSICFSCDSHNVIADQERRAKEVQGTCRVCFTTLICFRCLRSRSHVSDSREFQKYPSLAEGFHALEYTSNSAE